MIISQFLIIVIVCRLLIFLKLINRFLAFFLAIICAIFGLVFLSQDDLVGLKLLGLRIQRSLHRLLLELHHLRWHLRGILLLDEGRQRLSTWLLWLLHEWHAVLQLVQEVRVRGAH